MMHYTCSNVPKADQKLNTAVIANLLHIREVLILILLIVIMVQLRYHYNVSKYKDRQYF